MKLYFKKEMIVTVKTVAYERNGKKLSFNKLETAIKGERFTVKMSMDFAQQNGIEVDKYKNGQMFIFKEVKFTTDTRTIFPVLWLKKITEIVPYDLNNIDELDYIDIDNE